MTDGPAAGRDEAASAPMRPPGRGAGSSEQARRQLVLIACVQVLAMATWFSASAVVPALRVEWGFSTAAATWVTASVQLGFVCGAVLSAVLNLPDRVPVPFLIGVSAATAAGSTAILAAFAGDLATAVPLRFVTGLALAGVYPPGLKLMASWFDRGRGFALGVLVGALTLGSALPHLVSGLADLPWRGVLAVSCGSALAGGVIAVGWLRVGPFAAQSPPFTPGYVVQLFRRREPRLANLGYLGHMWELYAMWTWLPAYLVASQAARGSGGGVLAGGVTAFAAIGIAGLAGCLLAGAIGDLLGRARTAAGAMIASASCCVLAAVAFGAHPAVVFVIVVLWGASVIADSGLFSTCLSDVVDRRFIGTALTTQTAIGFLLTVVTIQAVPLIVDALGWRVALVFLAVGPLAGAAAMLRLAAAHRA